MTNADLTLLEFIPPVLVDEHEDPAFVTRGLFGAIAELETDLIVPTVRDAHLWFDIGETQDIDLVLRNLGNPFRFDMTDKIKRRLARALPTIYRAKGTAPGIERAILLLTGIEAEVVPDGSSDTWWVLGISELGVQTYLGGSPTESDAVTFFVRYLSRNPVDADEQARVEAIVEFMKLDFTRALYELLP